MAPKIPSVISCSTASLLEYELSEVRAGLELLETEDSWNKICNAILRLNAIVVGSAEDYPTQIIAACKGFVRPIINSLNSERSRLSGAATDLLTTLATHLQRSFETLIPLFVPTLLTLTSRSNKIFMARAKTTLMAIVEHCQSPALIPLLRHSISDKSVSLRLAAIDLVVACLNCYNPPDLEAPNRVEDIETVIKATARDASADVRKSSRRAFEAYKILFPTRVAAFVAPLTPTMRKYLDVKGTTANQLKPLLSSSTSAPSVPSSSKPIDALSHSQPVVQAHTKSASTSAAPSTTTTFTRVEKPTRAASKPPSRGAAPSAPVADSVLMPPPPPPEKKPSSGPVRPPPAMMQAIAAAASSRPKLGRLASRPNLKTSGSMVSNAAKSQPTSSHSGAQRPEKVPPPTTSTSLDAAHPVTYPSATEEPARMRSTTGPRRVPKVEVMPATVSAPSAPPAPSHKQTEILKESAKNKGKGKEEPTFAMSTSGTHAELHAPSYPPSQPASSTISQNIEDEAMKRRKERVAEKERMREREERKRNEARPEEAFRPRPVSHAEESRKRADSKEQYARPASRVDERQPAQRPPSRAEAKPIFTRPPSRVEKEPQARPESRVEPAAPERPRKKVPVDQPVAQVPYQQVVELDAEAQARALVKAERRRRREERAAEAARAAEALTRAPSKRGKERSAEEMPAKKRRGEGEEGEVRRRKHREVHPSQDVVSLDRPIVDEGAVRVVDCKPQEESCRVANFFYNDTVETSDLKTALKTGSAGQECDPLPKEGNPSHSEVVAAPRTPTKPEKAPRRAECHGIRPLVIHKASAENSPIDFEADAVGVDASFIPLPPSPPVPVVPETPAPLRQAIAARRNQVPATPISKLMATIQRGFEMDQNAIEEENEGDLLLEDLQPLPASTSAPEAQVFKEMRVVKGEDHRRHRSHEVKAQAEDSNPFFVDTRPRKHKPESSKVRGHNGRREHNDPRVPFMPMTENR